MADDELMQWGRCVLLLSFLSAALSMTAPPIELCGAANYDVWNLTSKIWAFSAPKEYCLVPRTENRTVEECQVTMAFCQPLKKPPNCANAAVCQTYTASTDSYNLATYANNPFNTSAMPAGQGFVTNYPVGEQYNSSCTLTTVMTFVCNASASWETGKAAEIMTVPNTANTRIQFVPGPKICSYSFTFEFAGACPLSPPVQPVSQLSAGSVLLLIFFVSVILYFVMGCFINIVRGKVGQDIIPHQAFWTVLPVYIMDGIEFTLSCCGKTRSRGSYEDI